MKKIFFLLFAAFFATISFSQPPANRAHETARSFMRSGDWDNAILVLNKALEQTPDDLPMLKDLALSYYYKRDYVRALENTRPLFERDDADEIVFQIGGNIYKALEDVKEAEKMYKRALRKFPKSGPLYSEYGELLWSRKDFDAIKEWEKGIEAAPAYAGNYYNAALYYYYTKDKIWTLIYGEIFVNMEYMAGESSWNRTTEMKKLLLTAYKEKLFNDLGTEKETKKKSAFTKAVMETFNRQSSVVRSGITTEVLHMLRTRFILDWSNTHGSKYPFRLFDYHQQLIKEGMFEAYNQWLFGSVENLPAYDKWTKANTEAFTKFANFQKNRVFKMPQGQYYRG